MKNKRKINSYNFTFGLILSLIMVTLTVAGMFWTPYDPEAMAGSLKLSAPAFSHIFRVRSVWKRRVQSRVKWCGKYIADRYGNDFHWRKCRDRGGSGHRIFWRMAG